MMFDMNSPSILSNLIVYPDWPYAGEPRLVIEEIPLIGGTSTGTSPGITGNVDNT